MSDDESPEVPAYETGFLVYLGHDNEFVVTAALEPFNIRRTATLRDMQRAMSELLPRVGHMLYGPPPSEPANPLQKALDARRKEQQHDESGTGMRELRESS